MASSPPPQNLAEPDPRLTLKSRLDDLARVPPWVEALAEVHGITGETRYAIELCLEEALSNVVRHGYPAGSPDEITVEFRSNADSGIEFIVEDRAPAFDPLQAAAERHRPQPASLGELVPGGQGIHLMQRFAQSVRYEQLPGGNRLILAFPAPGAA